MTEIHMKGKIAILLRDIFLDNFLKGTVRLCWSCFHSLSFIFDQMLQSMSSDCYKVTISSITYEVLFSYDNSYYTHCYHQTVKEYKSNGSLIRSKTDYYQAIGG